MKKSIKAPPGAKTPFGPKPGFPAGSPSRRPRCFPGRFPVADLLHVVAILAITYVVWGWAYHRLWPSSWSSPMGYGGDTNYALTCLRAASEFEYLPFLNRTNARLGAPYTANWNDFPIFESLVTFFLGLVARWSNLGIASTLGVILSHLTSALSFYLCCRLLRFRREWAAAGSLLWAFTYYHATRANGLAHLLIAYDYTVPLAMVCCWLLTASKRIRIGGWVFWVCLGAGLLMGMSNPYNLNMWAQFVCLGMGLRFLLYRRKAELAVGSLVLAAGAAGFLAVNANYLWYQAVHGANQIATTRDYKQLELYGLKPLELFLPPIEHRVAFLGDLSRKYAMTAWVRGEMFSPYLGLVAIGALVWMVVEFFLRMLNLCKVPRRFSLHLPQCLWVVLYSAIGGGNCVLGLLFGITYFRGSNRYSIWISVICLLFLVSRMSRIARRWNNVRSYGLAMGVAALGLLDQLPLPPAPAESRALAEKVNSDRAFCRKLEAELPQGTMIFQVPVMNFIEADPINECGPYEHLRPYLWTKTLRFSSGSVQGRYREVWQNLIMTAPIEQRIPQLEQYGFGAICYNRKAFTDRAEGAIRDLARLGKTQLIEDDAHELVCVRLTPSPHPTLPHSDDAAHIVYKRGWVFAEEQPGALGRCAAGNASLYFVNENSFARGFRLNGTVVTISPRQVEVEFEGHTIWSRNLGDEQNVPLDVRITAKPGRNYLYFKTDRPPVVPKNKQMVRLSYAIVNLLILKDPPTAP
jgi:phosphoglycerol transferase